MEDVQTIETPQATPEIVETPPTEQAVTTENAEPSTEVGTKPEKTFTQAELDAIITKRIERERESTAKRVAQEARDTYIKEQGYTWQGKPITTEAEYRQALQEQKWMEQYQSHDLPEDVVQELVEGKKFREQYQQEKQTNEQKAKQDADFAAFLQTYPDVKASDIPENVWQEVNQGKSLVDAYARHENQLLKQQLAEFKQSKQVEQQNAENAASSTGSVTGNGSVAPVFFTPDQVSKMSLEETNKNWAAINESMKKW